MPVGKPLKVMLPGGRLVILKDGAQYNVQGQKLR